MFIKQFIAQQAVGYADGYTYWEGTALYSDGETRKVYSRSFTTRRIGRDPSMTRLEDWRTLPYPGHPGINYYTAD